MHSIEINYMSCIPCLLYVMYFMAKTCLYMYEGNPKCSDNDPIKQISFSRMCFINLHILFRI